MDSEYLNRIMDDELCPCGSNKIYADCCRNRKDEKIDLNKLLQNEGRMNYEIINILKTSKIRTCLYPTTSECSNDSINAHSLQNNGVLSHLAENNHVIIIEPGVNKNGLNLNIKSESKNKATTFTGFCKYHDTEVFKPIETKEYDPKSDEQNFLFSYRIYAYEYYKKIVAFKSFQKTIRKMPTRLKDEVFVGIYRNYQLSLKDLNAYKNILNASLLNKEYTIIQSYVVEFDYKIPFATCFGHSPLFDFKGNTLSLDHMIQFNEDRLKMNFVTIIPQENKSYLIYSWLKEDESYFAKLISQLRQLDLKEVIRIFNNLIPEYSENLVLAPKLWNRFSDYQKEYILNKIAADFPTFESEAMMIPNSMSSKSNLGDRAPYNLFRRM